MILAAAAAENKTSYTNYKVCKEIIDGSALIKGDFKEIQWPVLNNQINSRSISHSKQS